MNSGPLRYRAFISYSHADERWAARLHRALEAYRLPSRLRGAGGSAANHPKRPLRPVFRDREELASAASLSENIRRALDESEALIVVCSPAAVASRWVGEEIRHFRTNHPDRPALAFVVAGDPGGDPRTHAEQAAIPLDLRRADAADSGSALLEPLAADARAAGDGPRLATLKLIAGLLAIPFDDLRQRDQRRRQRLWAAAALASLVLSAIFAVLAWRATVARDEARAARLQAELELVSERQTREFLLSVFKLADPGEARGESVTVREVLDAAVARIDSAEFAKAPVRARYLATMGQAYSSLGLNRRSVELLRASLDALPSKQLTPEVLAQRIDSRLELADVWFDMGEYAEALAALEPLSTTPLAAHATPLQQARRQNIRGDILSYLERDAEAMISYREALNHMEGADATPEELARGRSRSIGGMAVLQYFAGDYPAALAGYERAADLVIPVLGEQHPDSIWALVSLGSAAYGAGQPERAKAAWTRSLSLAQQVLGEGHPEVGTIKNNLGRLLFETGEYAPAEALLRQALEIDRRHRSQTFDDLAYVLNNLALTLMAQGDDAEALDLLREGLMVARASEHRMLGPILAGMGELNCALGEPERGLEAAEESLAVIASEFGEDDWRHERAWLVRAECRRMLGQEVDRARAEQAARAVTARWGSEAYFGRRAAEHLAAGG